MIRTLTAIGLCVSLLSPQIASAQEMFYFTIRKQAIQEHLYNITPVSGGLDFKKVSELPVERFTAGSFYTNFEAPKTVSPTEQSVDLSLNLQYKKLCGETVDDSDYYDCTQEMKILDWIAAKTSRLRSIGRKMQLIASGYEMGMDGAFGRSIKIVERMPSVAHIWQARNDPLATPIIESRIRSVQYSRQDRIDLHRITEELKEKMDELVESSSTGKEDRSPFIAAVWRYQHGVMKIREDEGACNDTNSTAPHGTIFQYVASRYCDVEEKLKDIYDELPDTDELEPPQLPEEHIVFLPLEIEGENYYVWAREDDVGLAWRIPIEPNLPALVTIEYEEGFPMCMGSSWDFSSCASSTDEPILGGMYPPPPTKSIEKKLKKKGMCSGPLGKRGYLCRPVAHEDCKSIRDESERNSLRGDGEIIVTQCNAQRYEKPAGITLAGLDVCGLGGWREKLEPPPEQIDTEDRDSPNPGEDPSGSQIYRKECDICKVDLICKSSCSLGIGLVQAKNEFGILQICVPPSFNGNPRILPYLIMKDLVHAQKMCDAPVGMKWKDIFNTPERCCAAEREAYLVACNAMAEDGIFDTNANITVEGCASALAAASCHVHGWPVEACYNDSMDPADIQTMLHQMVRDVKRATQIHPGLPSSCSQAVNNLDSRSKAIKRSLPQVCSPICLSRYENTIGNNLCFAGQCLEQSLEWHRMIPGRMSLIANDESFPYDSCINPDPSLGNVKVPPIIPKVKLPLHRPEAIMQKLDEILCQLNGFPARMPPSLCSFDERRRFDVPLAQFLPQISSLLQQASDYLEAVLGVQHIASGIGSQLGTRLLSDYLEGGSRMFADVMQMANELIDDLETIEFTQNMCPRYAEAGVCEDLTNAPSPTSPSGT